MLLTVPAGKPCLKRRMRIHDLEATRRLIVDIERIRFFCKPDRYSDWEEVSDSEIRKLTYEDYEASAPAQGVAFIVSKKP
jgi:hypothetical protein